MTTQAQQLHALLQRLQSAMQECDLWATKPPAPEAFMSTEPFCVDTMGFSEWLQWVFIGRLHALIEANSALPSGSSVAALAEELWKEQPRETRLLVPVLEQIDACLNGQ
ncbi:MAG TPA: YqcC family protein [Alcanivoracaceae bacterium]|nr:YqcC family protein [Alcanivoracaceae bacterium]